MEDFWYIYHFKDLIKEPTCLKIKLLEKFPRKASLEAGLSDFHKIKVSKMFYTKQKHDTKFYRNYKTYDSKILWRMR